MDKLRQHQALRFAATLALAAGGGWLATALHLPLPWVLGSMAGVTLISLAGQVAQQPGWARRGAQMAIGTALGLYFTPQVVAQVSDLVPWIVLGATFALVLSVLGARVMQRMTGFDGPTAIYSVALGASAEMTIQAQHAGADGAMVASSHAVRIILVTSLASLIAGFSGVAPGYAPLGLPLLPIWMLLALIPTVLTAAVMLNKLKVPNAWVLGPMLVTGICAYFGLIGRLPMAVLVIAQIAIGWNLGQNLTRRFFTRAPRVVASAALVTLGILALCFSLAALIAHHTGLPQLTAFLSLAPGGMGEMGVLAKSFGLAAPVVTAFHLTRILCTIFLTRPLAHWMLASGWVRH